MAGVEQALKEALTIDGALGAALVDLSSGMALGTLGHAADLDLTLAAAGSTDLVRATRRATDLQGRAGEAMEDILTTLTHQYHLIRPLTGPGGDGLFLYLVLDRSRANLAMARHQARLIESSLTVCRPVARGAVSARPISTVLTGRPAVVRFSPNVPGRSSRPNSAAQSASSSAA